MKVYVYNLDGREMCRSKSPVTFSRSFNRVAETVVNISPAKSKPKPGTVENSPEKSSKE